MTDSLFNATIAQVELAYAYRAKYNNSWWSKLAMKNTMANIRERIIAAVNGDPDAFEFVVYAAHDTTIMPILGNLKCLIDYCVTCL